MTIIKKLKQTFSVHAPSFFLKDFGHLVCSHCVVVVFTARLLV